MNRFFPTLAAIALCPAVSTTAGAAKVYYPIPGLVNESVGLMESYVAGDWYRGSATVARDPKLLFSCAHLFFETGEWATDYNFYRACHSKYYPAESTAVSPRGLHYFTSYSSGVKSFGSESEEAFASDFTVLYGNSSFGTAVDWWPMGGPPLRSGKSKRIVGYPSDIDFTGDSGRCYQHSTDWFNFEGFKIYGAYHEYDDVSTGPGNSGGPIFVRNPSTGDELLAGILVSGTRRTAGVVALDRSTDAMASDALGLVPKTLTFSNTAAYALPDGSKTYVVIPIRVSAFSGAVSKLKLSLSVTTKRSGDLEVYLKSPAGRIRWITRGEGGSADDLIVSGLNLSNSYSGAAPNGNWELHLRDTTPGNRAVFQSASLSVTAL